MRSHQAQQAFTHALQKLCRPIRFARYGCLSVFVFALTASCAQCPAKAQDLLSGREFDARLTRLLSGGPFTQPMADVVQKIATENGVATILDRRIDPNQPVKLEFTKSTIPDVLRQAAAQIDAHVAVLDNVVVIGPKKSIGKLATLIRLRQKELSKFRSARSLKKTSDVSWPILAEPKPLIAELAKQHKIRIENIDVIPHDLWRATSMPDTDGVTALSVILIQFGMTFEYLDGGKAIRLALVPEKLVVEERVRISKKSPKDLLEFVRRQFPDAEIRRSGTYLKVKGNAEDIEAIRRLALGETASPRSTGPVSSLDSRRFKLTAKAPARKVLEAVLAGGTQVVWDEAAFQTAGIDLGKRVSIDVNNATARELFKDLCDQLSIGFRVEKQRVVLLPKP